MHQEGNALIYENDGELLRIEPWGKNSLRVRSVMQGPICDTDYALIELNEADKAIVPSISVSEYEASITKQLESQMCHFLLQPEQKAAA